MLESSWRNTLNFSQYTCPMNPTIVNYMDSYDIQFTLIQKNLPSGTFVLTTFSPHLQPIYWLMANLQSLGHVGTFHGLLHI